jgi:hypothetical protein
VMNSLLEHVKDASESSRQRWFGWLVVKQA